MTSRLIAIVALACVAGACGRDTWPDPPAVDRAAYDKEYQAWRASQQETVSYAIRLLGIWVLPEGDTSFGSDPALPIVLPDRVSPARAGLFRRSGETITVVPAPGAPLRLAEGGVLDRAAEVDSVSLGSVQLSVAPAGDADHRMFVSATDEDHPALKNLRSIDTYPVDQRWRVAARFDAFDTPKAIKIADIRGGTHDGHAVGELVFRLSGTEQRLTAIGEPGEDHLFVMFKDPTNASTTYQGYRILSPAAVAAGQWTVLDFNMASNPPCAYSPYTTCPLPPRENRLQVAVEAGEKRHPTAKGFAGG